MKIVICIKDNENEICDRDLSAMGFAMDLSSKIGAEVYGISFGKFVFDRLKEIKALGAKACYGYRSDDDFDFYDSAKIISKLIEKIDESCVVIMSHGDNRAVIPSMVAEFLNYNSLCGVRAFDYKDELVLTRKTEDSLEKYEIKTPCVIGINDTGYEPKKPRKTIVDTVDENEIKIFNKDNLKIDFNKSIKFVESVKKNNLVKGEEITGNMDEKVNKIIEILRDNDIIR